MSPNNPEIWGAASRGPDFIIAASANNLAKSVYAIGFGGRAAAGRPAIALTVLALLGFAAAVAYLA